ncbi:unnamed protein product [Rhizophagus irregularis]|nr:unnamed protein product [Rhizophagus irregularis]
MLVLIEWIEYSNLENVEFVANGGLESDKQYFKIQGIGRTRHHFMIGDSMMSCQTNFGTNGSVPGSSSKK